MFGFTQHIGRRETCTNQKKFGLRLPNRLSHCLYSEGDIFESSPQLNTRYSEHRTCVTGDGQRRGARRDDGVSLSDERGPKNGFGKPVSQ